jgi:hypothetical protein
MKLTAPINVPPWLARAVAPTVSVVLLLCAIDFINWQFILPAAQNWGMAEAERCFDNQEPLMPLAELVHVVVCPANGSAWAITALNDLTRLCLYGGVIVTWLAARTISGWWSAGIAAAFVSTSPLLFGLDNRVSPASLGVLFATLSSWLAAQEFGGRKPRDSGIGQLLWVLSALLAIGMHVMAAWIVIAQGIYVLVQRRQIASPPVAAAAVVLVCAGAIAAAIIPTDVMASAMVRADVSALPQNVFAFAYPDEWMSAAHGKLPHVWLSRRHGLRRGHDAKNGVALPCQCSLPASSHRGDVVRWRISQSHELCVCGTCGCDGPWRDG